MPMRRELYPADWEAISLRVRARAGWCCQWCGAENYCPHPLTGSRVVLTVAHVYDRTPANCADDNLAALCQRCHLGHDRDEHMRAAARTRRARKALGDLFAGAPQ